MARFCSTKETKPLIFQSQFISTAFVFQADGWFCPKNKLTAILMQQTYSVVYWSMQYHHNDPVESFDHRTLQAAKPGL